MTLSSSDSSNGGPVMPSSSTAEDGDGFETDPDDIFGPKRKKVPSSSTDEQHKRRVGETPVGDVPKVEVGNQRKSRSQMIMLLILLIP